LLHAIEPELRSPMLTDARTEGFTEPTEHGKYCTHNIARPNFLVRTPPRSSGGFAPARCSFLSGASEARTRPLYLPPVRTRANHPPRRDLSPSSRSDTLTPVVPRLLRHQVSYSFSKAVAASATTSHPLTCSKRESTSPIAEVHDPNTPAMLTDAMLTDYPWPVGVCHPVNPQHNRWHAAHANSPVSSS